MIPPQPLSPLLQTSLLKRRQQLADRLEAPVILWSGCSSPRNYPANTYPFRASSHFLYFAGLPLEHAAIRLEQGSLELFMEDEDPAAALWHGESACRSQIAAWIQAKGDYPLSALKSRATGAVSIPNQDGTTHQQQIEILGRQVSIAPETEDLALAKALIELRLIQDEAALDQLRQAAAVTVAAHRAGMAATRSAHTEAEVRAVMEQVILAHQMTCAYASIVTTHGEILHNPYYHRALHPGDLILADLGAESSLGWAADVSRTWPVSGHFSPTQRDLYTVVLAAHDACIAQAQPGVEYRDLHLLAARVMAEGLVDLGFLRGHPEDLVDQDAHALFFPHGVGHLLGLDVHDMEDLGDLAGYAEGRTRSSRFGLGYLRLDRVLQPGMLVTIEPGFYQVPRILREAEQRGQLQECVRWDRLAQFADVRGIRIEDDVLITDSGCEVLTQALPTQPAEVEQLVQG